ncbi:sugar-binding protein [uncultured Microbacterium sp.]|uniref:sugar-binding protein n=1 Tax=uncultured Microbacterium sp. TaxID=191216 RepID=UPI0035CC468B
MAAPANGASAVVTPGDAATADPPTLQDYWNGDADWTLVKKTSATDSGIMNAADGQRIVATPDGTWYRFSRAWGTGGSCQLSSVVRASSDQGATWSAPETVVAPEAGTAWSCYATDGGAFYNQDQNRWYFLFQCHNGSTWAGCVVTKDGADPRGGGWVPVSTSPVVKSGDLWKMICDDPTDDCVSISSGSPVRDEGTFDIFQFDGTYYWVAFHGFDGIRGYRGIAKTADFTTWIAGDTAEGLPADATFDRKDSDTWRETWRNGSSIGVGHGSILKQEGYFYQIVEAADRNLACAVGQRWDVGIYRTADLTSTAWEGLPMGNPFLYSSLEPRKDGKIQPCQIVYPSVFEDPTSRAVYLSYGILDDLDPDRNAVVWLKLSWKTNLLSNGNFWKATLDDFTTSAGAAWAAERVLSLTADASPSLSVTPGAEPATISQTVTVDPALGSSLIASGKIRGDGTGSATLVLSQLDGAGAVLSQDRKSAPVGADWAELAVPVTVTAGAASLRYDLIFEGAGQVLRADDLHLGAAETATYTAHRTSSPIVIDGVADEGAWTSAGAVEVSDESADVKTFGTVWGSVKSRADLTSTFRVTWDESALYVTEERKDDVVNFTESSEALYVSDAIMLFLDTDGKKTGTTYLDGDYALLAAASDPVGQSRVYLREGHNTGDFTDPLASATIASTIRSDGYTLELAIPWSALSVTELTPADGTEYGFTLLGTDNDGGGDWGQIMWAGTGDEQSSWATLRLVGAADPGTGEPGTGEPGTGEPGNPGPGTPGSGGPGAPGSAGPGTSDPGSGTSDANGGGAASSRSGSLARTGSDTVWLFAVGFGAAALIACGFVMVRRRRS